MRISPDGIAVDEHGEYQPWGWLDLDQLLRNAGREEYLAKSLERRRKAKGWSQERLAEELKRLGQPMPQSAISKIENPAPGGRRAITVDEALALARALDVNLADLLLPPGSLERAHLLMRAHEAVLKGGELRAQMEEAEAAHTIALAAVRTLAAEDETFREEALQHLEMAQRSRQGEPDWVRAGHAETPRLAKKRAEFLTEALADYLPKRRGKR